MVKKFVLNETKPNQVASSGRVFNPFSEFEIEDPIMEQGTLKVRVADAGPQSRWCKPYLLHVNGLICAKLIQWRRRRIRRSRLRGPSLRLRQRRTHLTLFRIQTPSVTIDQGEVPSAVSAWERMGPRFVSDSDSTRRRLSCGGRRNRLRVDEKATSPRLGSDTGKESTCSM